MKRIRLVTGLIATNVYLIGDETTGEAAVIDPAANCRDILAEAERNGLTVGKILLTHGHFDHIGAADELSVITGAEIYVSAPDAELLSDGNKNGSLLFLRRAVVCRSTARIFHDGDVISVGGIRLSVLYTPGHTRGSVCFFAQEDGACESVFTGDTVFSDGYGRTDLYGGDGAALERSLAMLLPRLMGKMIYPGHGEPKRFGEI